ncbi:MAG: TRAP transporter small permease [Synergistes sp.]|jgi:TRAP-type C4-dicarboxylate transport system permease small subunit|nr:TRAP transporter small permease [Synergistes sp.]
MPGKDRDLLKRAFRPLELLLICSVIVVFVVVLIEVVSRYIFHQSIAWGSEVCQTLLVWITFIGAAVALVGGEHMEINIMMDRIRSRGVKKLLMLIGDIATMIFLVCGTVGGVRLVKKTWNMTTTTLQIPAGILYLAFPLGCALMIIVVARNIIRLFGREE